MLLAYIGFSLLAACAIASALMMIASKNSLHSAGFFCATLIATAGIYLQLHSELLFVIQLMLFAGCIVALFTFASAFTNFESEGDFGSMLRQRKLAIVVWVIAGIQITAAMVIGGKSLPGRIASPQAAPLAPSMGDAIFRSYLLPFEMTSILVVVALIGAFVAAKRRAS
jgi:NADH-quinone oxidoreductase subunit J